MKSKKSRAEVPSERKKTLRMEMTQAHKAVEAARALVRTAKIEVKQARKALKKAKKAAKDARKKSEILQEAFAKSPSRPVTKTARVVAKKLPAKTPVKPRTRKSLKPKRPAAKASGQPDASIATHDPALAAPPVTTGPAAGVIAQ